MAAKALYWLYIILPPMVAASNHVTYVSCRPVYINSAVLWPGHLPVMLQSFIWIPAFLIWLFDMQASKVLCTHQPSEKLSGLPWFVPSEMTSLLPQHHKSPVRLPTGGEDRYYRRGTFFRTATGGPQNQPAYIPAPSFALPSAPRDFRKSSVRYANTNDPYMSMYFDCERDVVDWRSSAVRHPTFIYCNELTAFLKVCEDFHYQVSGDMLRLCSKQALARKFYTENFATDPEAKDPRRVEPQRLLWVNFRGLKTLVNALQKVFDLAQKASFWMPDDSGKLVKANAELKKALLAMIMLPSNKPEELGGPNIPVPVQDYIKAASICFDSPSLMEDMPSVLPAPLQRGEVAVMLEQLGIILKHTSLLLLSSEEESQATSAEGRESAELGKIASTEHALKLFFRRAARILRADDPSFRCAEAQRRFGTFINSLLMKIPETPLVRNMVSMMTLTPYYREDTRLDLQDIRAQMQQSGLLHRYDRFCELLQEWASYRGQAYLEETAPEDLHLCRDSNRLDDTQLRIIRSPEGALWREVVDCTPPYELQQSTRELAHLKYQYVVAAQEFGTDLGAQMPRGCEPSPALRAQLLRKVAVYKLLVRYPSLRIATLEHERSPEGRLTGHKVSVLYRLTADVDPVGERIAARAAANVTQMRAAGRFLRTIEQEVLPASIPALLVPAPRIPVCTPGANMEANSKVRIKPRSGGSSSGDRQSAEASSSVSIKTSTTPPGICVQQANSFSPAGTMKGRPIYHGGEDVFRGEDIRSIQSSIVEGTRQLLTKGSKVPGRKISHFLNPDEGGDGGRGTVLSQDAHSNLAPSHPQRSGKGDVGSAGGAGDFESKISRAIHWLHQKKQFDRTLFAARTKRALKNTISPSPQPHKPPAYGTAGKDEVKEETTKTSEGPQETLLSRLCQDLPHELDEAPGLVRAASIVRMSGSSRTIKHSDTSKPDSQLPLVAREPQTQTQLQAAALHSSSPHASLSRAPSVSHLTKIPEEYGEGENPLDAQTQTMSGCAEINQFSEILDSGASVEDVEKSTPLFHTPRPTLLEAQFARDLARDCMAPAMLLCPGEPSFSSPHASLNIHEEGVGQRSPSHTTSEQDSSRHRSVSSIRTHAGPSDAATRPRMQLNGGTYRLRSHSIITLHPRKEGLLPWDSLATIDGDSWDYDRISHIRYDVPRDDLNDEVLPSHDTDSQPQTLIGWPRATRGGVLLRKEPSHRTEYLASPQTEIVETRAADRINSNEERSPQSLWTAEEHEQRHELLSKPSGSAVHRSNSLSKLRDRGLLSMKERVAFFEDRLSRHQAQMEAEACNLARRQQASHRRGMLWPSRRGPLRLEAIYKIRLPLIMDESGAPWGRTPIIGPGKPENQNHAIAFSRMDTMQVMDMNMESYLEEAIKLRNLLQEFVLNARMRILGNKDNPFPLRALHLCPITLP
ncbi:hypothetical protein Emag_005228 [Eimeria magna]